MASFRSRHYGVAKGSKNFPFRVVIIDVNAITLDQAQADWDFLTKRRLKLVRMIARWHDELPIGDVEAAADIPDEIISLKEQIDSIEHTLATLVEQYPEVRR